MPRRERSIYLTFDDGPVPGLTEWVLDLLKEKNAGATFFCVGDNIRKHRSIYDRILSEGHVAGNHTMHHSRGFRNPTGTYLKEADECRSLVNNRLFRPPYGQMKRAQYRGLLQRGYRIILWDVISYDYENISPGSCARTVLKKIKPGSIVLFHDNVKAEKNLRHVLPMVLDRFGGMGYSFKSLPSEIN
jgi:peptidoglycan-N-acetylglucosamine deacetylase